jgi:glycosyltransferase involved in cell wall biosynthesis
MLLTSDHEGLPMILLEAMALGVPVIAHATGGIPDLLGHGACGILVKEQSAASYASEIIALAEKSIDVCRLIQNAKNRIKTSYSASRNSVAYISEYAALARYRGTSFARD